MNDAALATSEVDERVAIARVDGAQRSGKDVPGRWHVGDAIDISGLRDVVDATRGVQPPVEDAIRVLFQPGHLELGRVGNALPVPAKACSLTPPQLLLLLGRPLFEPCLPSFEILGNPAHGDYVLPQLS